MARLLEDCHRVTDPESGATIYEGRYYNANGFNTVIVAMVMEGVDWAAYLGASDSGYLGEDSAIVEAAGYGAKLSEADARYYFDVDMSYRH